MSPASKHRQVLLVCGGRYHDFDFARLELLKLLAEHPSARVSVAENYRDIGARLDGCDLLVTYTCDEIPDESGEAALKQWLGGGHRWFALHGSNSIIQFASTRPLKIKTPADAQIFMGLLGSQFLAHPPIGPYRVEISDPAHPLVAGLESFDTVDELYLTRTLGELEVLLHCKYRGELEAFEHTDWTDDADHPVLYLKRTGAGQVLYLTLGHCRGHHDMQPLTDYYPRVERCSWELPQFYELLRRGLRWGLRVDAGASP
ncbi:MAG: ThuA domain-containing protein [Pseudomonadota bacterium]